MTHVINYDFPLNPSDYIHRAGRVGRVGGAKVKYLQKTLLVWFRVKRKVGFQLKLCSLILYLIIYFVQGSRVTSLVDNQGGVKVVQNLEIAVRKNIEIQQVTDLGFENFLETLLHSPR